MAVGHNVTTEAHTGTTGHSGSGSFTWNSGAGTCRCVVVFVFTFGTVTKTVSAVSYDGQLMTEIPALAVADTAGELGRIDVFFIDNVASGSKAIVVTRTNNAIVMTGVSVALTAAAACEIYTAGAVLTQEEGAIAEVNVTDGSPGTNSLRLAAAYTGAASPPTAGANSTLGGSIDLGAFGAATARETTAGQGSRPVGLVAGSDDRAYVAFAVRETPAGTTVVGANLIAPYDVRALRGRDLIAPSDLRALRARDLIAPYDLKALRARDLIPTYDLLAIRARDLIAPSDLRALRGANVIAPYDLRAIAGRNLIGQWRLGGLYDDFSGTLAKWTKNPGGNDLAIISGSVTRAAGGLYRATAYANAWPQMGGTEISATVTALDGLVEAALLLRMSAAGDGIGFNLWQVSGSTWSVGLSYDGAGVPGGTGNFDLVVGDKIRARAIGQTVTFERKRGAAAWELVLSHTFPGTGGAGGPVRAIGYGGISFAGGQTTRFDDVFISPYALTIAVVGRDLIPVYDLRALRARDLIPVYDLRVPRARDLIPLYDVRALRGANVIAVYDLRALRFRTLIPVYDLRALRARDLVPVYDVRNAAGRNLIPLYDVRALRSRTAIAVYDVRATRARDLIGRYDLRAFRTRDLIARYDVEVLAGTRGRDLIARWDLRALRSKTLVSVYDVRNTAGRSLIAPYDVRNVAARALIAPYDLRALRSRTLVPVYDLRALRGRDAIARYDVIAQIGRNLIGRYDLRALRSRTLVVVYDVAEGTVGITIAGEVEVELEAVALLVVELEATGELGAELEETSEAAVTLT